MSPYGTVMDFFTAQVSFDWYTWVGLPIIIFLARVFDVTLGTLRIIFLSRGKQKLAPVLGFFEVLIWITIIGQLVQHIHSVPAYFGYAAGFAAGNYIGLWLEERLAIGTFIIRTIVSEGNTLLEKEIHDAGFGFTRVDAEGSAGKVKIIYTIVRRVNVEQVMEIIQRNHPNAFVSVEEVRSAEHGIFPKSGLIQKSLFFRKKGR